MKQRPSNKLRATISALLFFAMLACAARTAAAAPADESTALAPAKPLVMWYSRTGTSQLVAETLQKQLGCDIDRISSKKDRGIMSIVNEQLLGGEDEQEKCSRNLAGYNPVFIAAPVYFMKLSAPCRSFLELNRDALKGKDIFIIVTMGGKLSDEKIEGIKQYGSGLALNIKDIACMPMGKKDEFPSRIREFLSKNTVQAAASK